MNFFSSLTPTWSKSLSTLVVLMLAFFIALAPCDAPRCVPGGGICASAYCHFPVSWIAWLIWPVAFYLIWSLIASRKRVLKR